MLTAQKIHMIGIGGIGISALAKLFLLNGKDVSGSDLHASDITRDLQRRGAIFHEGHEASFVPDETELVIYSPAVPESNVEFQRALELKIPLLSYADALGELSKQYSTIVVTGTHGKSTTTAMLGLILEAAGYDPTVIVGSFVPSFEHGNLRVGHSRFLVLEGCEHQANILNLYPEMIVLTSIEADHLDFYKTLENIKRTFQKFIDRLGNNGIVVINEDDPVSRKLVGQNFIKYGINNSLGQAVIPPAHHSFSDGGSDPAIGGRVEGSLLYRELKLKVPGVFNRYNALAAVTAAMELGVPFEICKQSIESFTGIWRRFERVGTWNGCEVISDYGHHPTAIRVTLEAAREMFPDKKIILCFQPHQHSRTQTLFNDFVVELLKADALVLPEIYRVEGRTEDESVSSRDIVDEIQKQNPNFPIFYSPDFQDAEVCLKKIVSKMPNSVLIIQGAGNIDELARRLAKKASMKFLENEPMSKHTNFRIGGPARWFVEVKSVDELKDVLQFAKEKNVPYFVFGGGSNILVNDKPFEGIAIKIAMRKITINGNKVCAEAGALSSVVARETAKAGLGGLTWMISLPGTIGGAVRGNAGCFGGETKDHIIEVEVLRDGEVVIVKKNDLHFGYRDSLIKSGLKTGSGSAGHSQDIVLSATFELQQDDPKKLLQELDEKLISRKSSQPLDAGSAGCMFKNYEMKSDEELQHLMQKLEMPPEMFSTRRISAGWLIDQLDLKGMQIGGAKVSEKHGNFLVNTGDATADNVCQLIALIKTRARNEYGINLEEEVQYMGF